METLSIKGLKLLKNHSECQTLDSEIISYILNSFENVDNKKNKKNYFINKKNNQILKNPKIKMIKDKIPNKVNLILNKISENNLSNLLIEFFNNIKIPNNDDYNEVIKTIYIKMLSETSFLKLYFEFFINIIQTYQVLNNWNCSYFYNLIENKFKIDYNDSYQLNDLEYEFLKDYEMENFRINNLNIIKEMISQKLFNHNFINIINNDLLNQTKYYSDIYHWFKNLLITDEQTLKINEILKNEINIREKILLESLLNNEPEKKKIIYKKKL